MRRAKNEGYEVTAAYDGEEALAKVKEIKPELLLLDIMMPKLDGIGVLWELKSNTETAKLPVIVLTNIGDVDSISKIVEAGATDYLLKSDQSIEEVVKKVREVLSRDIKLG